MNDQAATCVHSTTSGSRGTAPDDQSEAPILVCAGGFAFEAPADDAVDSILAVADILRGAR